MANSGTRAFLATALIVVGILWMTLTGLCTGVFFVQSFQQGNVGAGIGMIPLFLVILTICVLPGFLLWLGGKGLRDRRTPPNV